MIPHAQREIFWEFERRVYRKAVIAVESVGRQWGNELRCHELARAVHRLLDIPAMRVVDGKVGAVEHSWLELVVLNAELDREKHGKYRKTIIDVYVPGRLPQVQLIDPFPLLKPIYEEGEKRTDINKNIVDEVFKEMRDFIVYGAVR